LQKFDEIKDLTMEDLIHLNRLSAKCMEVIKSVANIHEQSKAIAEQPLQERIDNLAKVASVFQQNSEEMQNCLLSFLKEITKSEEDVADASETEFGYKL